MHIFYLEKDRRHKVHWYAAKRLLSIQKLRFDVFVIKNWPHPHPNSFFMARKLGFFSQFLSSTTTGIVFKIKAYNEIFSSISFEWFWDPRPWVVSSFNLINQKTFSKPIAESGKCFKLARNSCSGFFKVGYQKKKVHAVYGDQKWVIADFSGFFVRLP